uniref:Uncharacterized protein n=1 Tax=Rhizophora mucronata TaxID=61149 RepID=A0A2P2QQP8_RHIMU
MQPLPFLLNLLSPATTHLKHAHTKWIMTNMVLCSELHQSLKLKETKLILFH